MAANKRGRLKWSERNSANAKGFVESFLNAQNLFYSYPVDKISTGDRNEFMRGNYTTVLEPLNPFLKENETFEHFLDGAFKEPCIDSNDNRDAESRMVKWARRVDGVRVRLAEPDPPQLPDSAGNLHSHPHGSVLDFGSPGHGISWAKAVITLYNPQTKTYGVRFETGVEECLECKVRYLPGAETDRLFRIAKSERSVTLIANKQHRTYVGRVCKSQVC